LISQSGKEIIFTDVIKLVEVMFGYTTIRKQRLEISKTKKVGGEEHPLASDITGIAEMQTV
jgi:hypothetical protein